MEGKKGKRQKEDIVNKLLQFRIKQLNYFKTKIIEPIEKLNWKKIKYFRRGWGIKISKLKNTQKLKKWYEEIQDKHPDKKYNVLVFEVEKFHEIEGGQVKNTLHSDSIELEPRITNLGDKPEVVFDHEVKIIMNELNLDPDWASLFKHYLLFGKSSIKSATNLSGVISERITYGKKLQAIEHRIALNISPNTPLEEIELLWNPVITKLQNTIRGGWLKRKRESELDPLLEKLINIDMEDERKGQKRSEYEKADILFGELDKNDQYKDLEPEKLGEIETNRVKQIVNLRYRYRKILLS